MARGAEDHPLARIGDVGNDALIGAQQGVQVDQVFGESGLAGARMHGRSVLKSEGWAAQAPLKVSQAAGSPD